MDNIEIIGGNRLKGNIDIAGAKNAALPLMAACLLCEEPLTLSNVPNLSDITTMANLLVHMGVELEVGSVPLSDCKSGRKLSLCAKNIPEPEAPYEIVRKMRASVVVLGPLLARYGRARVSLPGGCAIGTRPIDYHLKALEQLGAIITLEEGYVEAALPKNQKRLQGADITFPKVSVGATENLVMAASIANGTTILRNAAQEPEVTDLCNCLIAMGAEIEGLGTSTLTINGKKTLHAAKHKVMADRIEAGSYAVAAAITHGDLTLRNVDAEILKSTLDVLDAIGVDIAIDGDNINFKRRGDDLKPVEITTTPFPGFATDMQAQISTLLCIADGRSTITETIFENRFMHVPELRRMGADISDMGNQIIIRGVPQLKGAPVMATDLRASVSLVLAGLAAEGKTVISRVYHLDRGYERLEEKLNACGAQIQRVRSE